METEERLYKELETVCKNVKSNFDKTKKELLKFLKPDEIINYYITQAPFPDFPDILFEVFILTDGLLYDYEMKQQGSLYHVLSLREINNITESLSEVGGNTLTIAFGTAGFGVSLVLQDKLRNKERLRMFSSKVKKSLARD